MPINHSPIQRAVLKSAKILLAASLPRYHDACSSTKRQRCLVSSLSVVVTFSQPSQQSPHSFVLFWTMMSGATSKPNCTFWCLWTNEVGIHLPGILFSVHNVKPALNVNNNPFIYIGAWFFGIGLLIESSLFFFPQRGKGSFLLGQGMIEASVSKLLQML